MLFNFLLIMLLLLVVFRNFLSFLCIHSFLLLGWWKQLRLQSYVLTNVKHLSFYTSVQLYVSFLLKTLFASTLSTMLNIYFM